jgi:hypothetical protein
VTGTYASVRTAGNVTVSSLQAIRYPTNWKEAGVSYGVYTGGYVTFVVENDDLGGSVTPKPRDTYTPSGESAFTVLSAQYVAPKTFWVLETVNLALQGDLRETANLYRPSSQGPDTAGNRQPTFGTTLASSAPCRFQEEEASEVEYMGKRCFERRFSVYFATDYGLRNEDQVHRGSDIHEVVGVENRERIDELVKVRTVHRGF